MQAAIEPVQEDIEIVICFKVLKRSCLISDETESLGKK